MSNVAQDIFVDDVVVLPDASLANPEFLPHEKLQVTIAAFMREHLYSARLIAVVPTGYIDGVLARVSLIWDMPKVDIQ